MSSEDIKYECRKNLCSYPAYMRARHIRGDIMEQIDDTIQQDIKNSGFPPLKPKSRADMDQSCEETLDWMYHIRSILHRSGTINEDAKTF